MIRSKTSGLLLASALCLLLASSALAADDLAGSVDSMNLDIRAKIMNPVLCASLVAQSESEDDGNDYWPRYA